MKVIIFKFQNRQFPQIIIVLLTVTLLGACNQKSNQKDFVGRVIPIRLESFISEKIISNLSVISNQYPEEKVYSICITRENINQVDLLITSLPNRESSIYDLPTPFIYYDSTNHVLFLFYCGLEKILQFDKLQILEEDQLGQLSLENDWDEEADTLIGLIGTYHEVNLKVTILGSDSIQIRNSNELPCFLPRMLDDSFSIPLPIH